MDIEAIRLQSSAVIKRSSITWSCIEHAATEASILIIFIIISIVIIIVALTVGRHTLKHKSYFNGLCGTECTGNCQKTFGAASDIKFRKIDDSSACPFAGQLLVASANTWQHKDTPFEKSPHKFPYSMQDKYSPYLMMQKGYTRLISRTNMNVTGGWNSITALYCLYWLLVLCKMLAILFQYHFVNLLWHGYAICRHTWIWFG